MSCLFEINSFLQVDHVFDFALNGDLTAVASGGEFLTVYDSKEETLNRIESNKLLDSPILVFQNSIFFDRFKAVGSQGDNSLEFTPFIKDNNQGLKSALPVHYSFTTGKKLYIIHDNGDLVRQDMNTGECEVPKSPYGVYNRTSLHVHGVGKSPKGAVALSRHAGRNEYLVDSLPDDPSRPIARAAILKDSEYGNILIGPAVVSRRSFILCKEKGFLLSIHLHKPELKEHFPVPNDLLNENDIILAADLQGGIWAASRLGIHQLTGSGAPALFPFPNSSAFTPARLIVNEQLVLLNTQEGKLFGFERIA